MRLMAKVLAWLSSILFWAAISGCGAPLLVAPLADQSLVVDEPEWNPGDEWVFRVTYGFSKAQVTEQVVQSSPGGYMLRSLETGAESYWLPGFRFLGMVRDGEIVQQYLPPLPMFKFPLKAGFTWRQGEGEVASGPT